MDTPTGSPAPAKTFGNDKGLCKFCGAGLGSYETKFYNTETGELACSFGPPWGCGNPEPGAMYYANHPWRYYTDG